ncbi:MFS transporter [Clostridium tarantellae]|nr:MFS transporter [Clostridium tarantellae]
MDKKNTLNYRSILKEKNFMTYLTGDLVSRLGDSIDFIAYGWLVFQVTGDVSIMALIFGVNAIPTILFQPIAGVFVEHKKKKKVLFICNFGRAIIVTITAIMFFMGILQTYHLFLFTFINSTFESFQSPAAVASLPLILDKDKYSYGMALKSTLSRVSELLGLPLAGLIIGVFGISGALLANALSFYFCGILICIIKYKDEILKNQVLNIKSYYKNLKEGFIYIKNTKLILSICIFGAILGMLIMPINTLSIAYVFEELLLGSEGLVILNIAITSGMLIGSFIFPKIKERFKGINMFIFSGGVFGMNYLLLAFIKLFEAITIRYILLFFMPFFMGIAINILFMLVNVAFMENIEQKYLSRAAGVFNSLAMSSTPVGSVLISIMCLTLSVTQLYFIFGIGIILLFIFQKYNKSIQKI